MPNERVDDRITLAQVVVVVARWTDILIVRTHKLRNIDGCKNGLSEHQRDDVEHEPPEAQGIKAMPVMVQTSCWRELEVCKLTISCLFSGPRNMPRTQLKEGSVQNGALTEYFCPITLPASAKRRATQENGVITEAGSTEVGTLSGGWEQATKSPLAYELKGQRSKYGRCRTDWILPNSALITALPQCPFSRPEVGHKLPARSTLWVGQNTRSSGHGETRGVSSS